jgi:hypothetical protein
MSELMNEHPDQTRADQRGRQEERPKDRGMIYVRLKEKFFVLAFLKINCTEMMKLLIYYDCLVNTYCR